MDFSDDSHQRDARHSHSVMTEEPQRLRLKFVLHFSTCVTKSSRLTLVGIKSARRSTPIRRATGSATTIVEVSISTQPPCDRSPVVLFALIPTEEFSSSLSSPSQGPKRSRMQLISSSLVGAGLVPWCATAFKPS